MHRIIFFTHINQYTSIQKRPGISKHDIPSLVHMVAPIHLCAVIIVIRV